MLTLMLLTLAVVGVAMLAMAVGTIVSNRCLRGSSGGVDATGPDGEPLCCDACPASAHTKRPNPQSLHSSSRARARGARSAGTRPAGTIHGRPSRAVGPRGHRRTT